MVQFEDYFILTSELQKTIKQPDDLGVYLSGVQILLVGVEITLIGNKLIKKIKRSLRSQRFFKTWCRSAAP